MRPRCSPWACRYRGGDICHKCGNPRKLVAHKRRAKCVFGKETVGEWVHLDIVTQAWGLDLPAKRELVRCHSSGHIEVWKDDSWLDDEYTSFTDHQQRKIRFRCYGSSHGTPMLKGLDQVPRMRKGDRFWVSGSGEHDGLWVCDTYREQQIVCHRILPDYSHGIDPRYRVRNVPWPNQESSSSAPTDTPTTSRSSTETKTE